MKKSEMNSILSYAGVVAFKSSSIIEMMEAKGQKWEPEEPEVLWMTADRPSDWAYRFRSDGHWQRSFGGKAETRKWEEALTPPTSAPIRERNSAHVAAAPFHFPLKGADLRSHGFLDLLLCGELLLQPQRPRAVGLLARTADLGSLHVFPVGQDAPGKLFEHVPAHLGRPAS